MEERKRMKTPILILLSLTLLITVTKIDVAFAVDQIEPNQVVERFCKVDFDGARLSSETSASARELTDWVDEPGWDSMVVITGYKLSKPQSTSKTSTISVKYDVAGVLDGWKWTDAKDMDTADIKTESIIEFTLEQRDGLWKVTTPFFRPHVGVNTALNITKLAWSEYENGSDSDGQRESLRETINILKKLDKSRNDKHKHPTRH
jgi:hypothetical protein